LIAEVSAGGVPVVLLVAVALTCGLVVRFLGLDLNGALAAMAGAIVVELMLALSLRSFGGAEELETLVAPMVVAAVLVPLVTAAALRLKDDPPERAQLGGLRRLAILAVLVCVLLVAVLVEVSWPAWLTALPIVIAWRFFKPAAVPTNERTLRDFVIGGALLIFAVELVAREHMWEGRVLVAAIVLGLVTLWLARAEGVWPPRARRRARRGGVGGSRPSPRRTRIRRRCGPSWR
jgi:amino acid transporter